MHVEHADLTGIPRTEVKAFVVGLARTVVRNADPDHPDPVSRLLARFAVAMAERVSEFDAGDVDVLQQSVYEAAVTRMCQFAEVPQTIPSLLEEPAR